MTNNIPEETLKEAAKHVNYEIRMFKYSYEKLKTSGGYDKNVFLEDFILHFRTLYDFFYKEKYQDNVLAEDFIPKTSIGTFEKYRTLEKDIEEYKKKANKQLAHITYSRADTYNNIIKPKSWKTRDMYQKIEKTIQAFISSLSDDRKDWFS